MELAQTLMEEQAKVSSLAQVGHRQNSRQAQTLRIPVGPLGLYSELMGLSGKAHLQRV